MATILIAEDHQPSRKILVTLLDYEGHRLLEAGDGEAALALSRVEKPDLIISDIVMPRMDGFEFVRQVRKDPLLARTPVILYTATYLQAEAEALARAGGATQFLAKPAEADVILATVEEMLRNPIPATLPIPSAKFEQEHRRLLIDKLANKAAELELEIEEHKRAEEALAERGRLAELLAEVSVAVTHNDNLADILQRSARALVDHLDAAFARIWTLNTQENMLELQASAGMYTHLDGAHGRVPVGNLKIGQIAAERMPHLTNEVIGDPRVGDQEWAKREGMVAFAGYPLIVGEHLVGVMALFARHPLTEAALQAMDSVASGIAIAIGRKKTEDALQRAHDDLELRVEQRTEELAAATEEANRANKAKSEFVSRMSHELRTPLNAILGFSQLLEMQELAPDNRESVDQILRAGRHLLALINEVLEIARVESGNLSVSLEPVNVREVVDEALALLHTLAGERGVVLYPSPADTGYLHVQADRQRIKQVLLNVLANAIKYNRAGGSVMVSHSVAPRDTVIIRVRDTGVGIAPGMMPRLFTPFDRLNAEQGSEEGTGLGLALTKRLVEAMNGRIWAESEFGIGSTFTIELPVAAHHATGIDCFMEGEVRERSASDEQTRTVLHIEDNLSNLRLVEKVFDGRPNVKLISAMQGSIGLDLFQQHRPDLVLLDLNLPDMSGRDVLTRLRQDAANTDIPIVMVSADATPRQIEDLCALGAVDYLTKPLDLKRLFEVLQEHLSGKK